MTEDEAKTKWCPMAREYVINATAADVGQSETNMPYGDITCIASECMAWQWIVTPEEAEKRGRVGMTYQPNEKTAGGYCGLAGKS